MTVSELIEQLKSLPQDAHVQTINRGDWREIDRVITGQVDAQTMVGLVGRLPRNCHFRPLNVPNRLRPRMPRPNHEGGNPPRPNLTGSKTNLYPQ